MKAHPGHFVIVIGGACAGSEAAYQLARRGIYSAVFDQKALPYGKIEDGLPKWHIKLRDKEERKIDEKLSSPYVQFVPLTKLGREVSFQEIRSWRPSAILLANGAWRDRPLPVEGIDRYVGKGLYYQNPFVEWFNHYHEPDYQGPQCEIQDGAIVIGGGLASLDVVKILMLETTLRVLRERGYQTNLFELEQKGIPRVLERLGVRWEDLGLQGCTLFYRRRVIDMPISPVPPGATPERLKKVYEVRKKILANFQRDYLFNFQECAAPVDKIVEGDRLAGIVFRRTRIENGKIQYIPDSDFTVRAPLIISSIGSIPEPIPGITRTGELYRIKDPETGQLEEYRDVFALGNAVTGRGNIRESEMHARKVVRHVMDEFLGWSESDYRQLQELVVSGGEALDRFAARKHLKTTEQLEALFSKVHELQQRVGYDGNYQAWVERHRPVRLEALLEQRGEWHDA